MRRAGRGLASGVLVVLLCVLFASASLPATAQAPTSSAGSGALVDLDVAVGFSDTVRLGRWAPVTVTLTNRGADLAGTLELEIQDGDELRGNVWRSTHRRAVELPAGSRKRLRFTVHIERFTQPLQVRLVSAALVVAARSVDLRPRVTTARLLPVLGRDADLDYLNDPREGNLRVLYPHPELLPDRWQGYDGVAAMVLHGMSLERLDEAQFEALRRWLAQGGILAVSGGADYGLLRTPRLAELLPGVPVGMARVQAGVPLPSPLNGADFGGDAFDVNLVADASGRVRLTAGDLPLVLERNHGRGRVLQLTFDVTRNPFRRWTGMPMLWLDLLRLPPEATLASQLQERTQVRPVLEAKDVASGRLPGRLVLLLFVALYVGVLLLGSRQPRQQGRAGRWPAPLMTWAAPLVFVPVAWLLFGPVLFQRGTEIAVVSVIEPYAEGPYADVTLQAGWYTSERGHLRLEYAAAAPVFRPVLDEARSGRQPANWLLVDPPGGSLQPVSGRRYALHRVQGRDVIVFDLGFDLVPDDEGLALELRNASGQALADAWLLFAGRAHALGAIAADAREIRRVRTTGTAIALDEDAWLYMLSRSAAAADAGAVAGIRRLLAAVRQREEAGGGEGHRAVLLGWVQSPLRLTGDSTGWQRREHAVVVVERRVALPEQAGRDR